MKKKTDGKAKAADNVNKKKPKNVRKRVVFICTGNTCRSPMAELILRTKLKQKNIRWWDVSSCGLNAEPGTGMSILSRMVLSEIGIDPGDFQSKQVTEAILKKSTVVFCMTDSQKRILEGKAHVFSIKDVTGREVPDPYGQGLEEYRAARDELCRACDCIIEDYITQFQDGEDKRYDDE
ncbi:MAG: hypothetical protein LUE27_00230 [Clostridia bacterium]|nr:hypothetical protein [Clostridia bacterium]